MKSRFRFTVFFSLLFSLLLLGAVFAIYYLSVKGREDDFNQRLWAQANYSYKNELGVTLPDSVQGFIDGFTPNTIRQMNLMMFNEKGNPDYQQHTDSTFLLPFLQNAKKHKSFTETVGDKQVAGYYIRSPKPEYILISGYDKFGIQRVAKLTNTLWIVGVIGVLLIVFSAFLVVQQITKPLVRIGEQMQRISESNMQERVVLKSSHFNYEESQIATHFNAMLDRLERAFELQRSFVHHASHELRTPLATMLAQTELALRKNLTIEDHKKVLESLKDDQQEMIELTNSLLLLSQYERTHTSPEWPVVRLDELLYETMAMVKRMLPDVNVSLEFAQMPDNEFFLSIQGNDSLIRSAFRNLIKNAWLYSDNKSVAITIDAEGSDIYLHFDNNGKLLSLEEQERLFIPFFRASNSTAKKGFGLGLNIIQRIVGLHKGSISYLIYNNMNRFTLQFPKMQSPSSGL